MVAIKKNSLKKNIAYNSLYNVLIIVIPLILSPYLSRTIGVEGVGLFSITFNVANYFKRTSSLGMEKYGNRSIALVKNDATGMRTTFWSIYKVQFLCSVVCICVYSVYAFAFSTRGLSPVLQGLFVLSALFDVSWYYFGNERFRLVVIISSITKISYLISTFIFVNDANDVNIYIALSALSYLLPNFVLFCIAVCREKIIKNTSGELKRVFKGALILFIPVIAVTLYKSMDKLMLGIMCETSYENGLYENAEKILHVPIAVISAVSSVLMPRMTKLYRDNAENQASILIHQTMKFAAFTSSACAFGLAGVSSIFSVVYWGEAFEGCSILLAMFSVSIPFMSYAEIIRTQFIIPNKRDKIYIYAVCIGALVNIVVNSALIPVIGAKGAVIGTLFAEASVCIYQAFKIRKALPVKRYLLEFLKYLPVGIIMATIVYFVSKQLNYTVMNLLFVVFCGALIYSVLSIIQMLIFDRDMLISLKSILNRKK